MAFIVCSCSDELKHYWDRLNKLTHAGKKNDAVAYAIGYFVINQLNVTDVDFNEMKIKLKKFYDNVDKVIKENKIV